MIPVLDWRRVAACPDRVGFGANLGRARHNTGLFLLIGRAIDVALGAEVLVAVDEFLTPPHVEKREFDRRHYRDRAAPGWEARGEKSGPTDHGEACNVGFDLATDGPCVLAVEAFRCVNVRPHGEDWVDVTCVPDVFVANVSDCLKCWASELYMSAPRRVLSPARARRSVATFLDLTPTRRSRTFPAPERRSVRRSVARSTCARGSKRQIHRRNEHETARLGGLPYHGIRGHGSEDHHRDPSDGGNRAARAASADGHGHDDRHRHA